MHNDDCSKTIRAGSDSAKVFDLMLEWESQRLDVDRDIDALLKTISEERAAIGAGLRHARVRFKTDAPNCQPMDWTNIYFVLAPDDAMPSNVRVTKGI
jgi:hypothetical protein